MRRQIKAWLDADVGKPKALEQAKKALSADAKSASLSRGSERMKVRAHRKPAKEFTELFREQEIQAHMGAVLAMKFSVDGRLLASAGTDFVIHVWEVQDGPCFVAASSDDMERSDSSGKASCSPRAGLQNGHKPGDIDPSLRKVASDLGDRSFKLSEKPLHSYYGHTKDVLDLSWSYSQLLLSASMDNTVRLWHSSSADCLRIFAHNDYVTCIQFNPVDDRYFISGSLDDKIRIWSIPDYQVVDWADIRAMVSAVCYTPEGEKAFVGTYKGFCRCYKTTANKLQLSHQFEVCENKKKKGYGKKIVGLQCMPGDAERLLITTNDSRVRLFNGTQLSCRYKGIRHTNGKLSASFSPDGHYIICPSEDSRVYIWTVPSSQAQTPRREADQSFEDFGCRDVCVAIPWTGMSFRPSGDGSPLHSHSDVFEYGDYSKGRSRAVSPWLGASRENVDAREVCTSRQLLRSTGHRLRPSLDKDGQELASESRSDNMCNGEQRTWTTGATKDRSYNMGHNLESPEYDDDNTSGGDENGCSGLRSSGALDHGMEYPDVERSSKQVLPAGSYASGHPSPVSSSELSVKSLSCGASPLEPYLTFQFQTSSISSQNSFSSADTREDSQSYNPQSSLVDLKQPSMTTSSSAAATSSSTLSLSSKPSTMASNGHGSPQLSSNSSSSVDFNAAVGSSLSKTSDFSVSRSFGLVIVTAGLGGEIRTYQNYSQGGML